MSTARQIEANRLNAQFSTGPRSAEGKARSSSNACKSGLDADSQFIPGERPEDFAALQRDYFDHFQPANPEERLQVDLLIRNEWLLRRLSRVEAQLWNFHLKDAAAGTNCELGEAFTKAEKTFARLYRRVTQVERSRRDAIAELNSLQDRRTCSLPSAELTARPTSPVPSRQSEAFKVENPNLGSFLNFASKNPNAASPATNSPVGSGDAAPLFHLASSPASRPGNGASNATL